MAGSSDESRRVALAEAGSSCSVGGVAVACRRDVRSGSEVERGPSFVSERGDALAGRLEDKLTGAEALM